MKTDILFDISLSALETHQTLYKKKKIAISY